MTTKTVSRSLVALGLASSLVLPAAGFTIDFETYPDGTSIADGDVITAQFTTWGVVFTDGTTGHKAGTILTSGISLNEFEFPPASGDNVLAEYEGLGLKGDFSAPVSSVSASFTYSWPIRLIARGASGENLGQVDSLLDANFISTGGSPNEGLLISDPGGIYAFEVLFRTSAGADAPPDAAFTLDDLTFTRIPGILIPELPVGWTGTAVIAALFIARRRLGTTGA